MCAMVSKILSVFAFLLASSTASSALTLDCALKPVASNGDFVSKQYVLQFDEASGQALASDPLILAVNGTPVAAKVSENSNSKLVFTWTLILTNSIGQTTKMQYRAAYFKTDDQIILRAMPGGYSNQFEARGRCRQV